MTDRELMQQALEALERYQVKRQDFDRFADEIAALRARLAQPEQEPVAWMWDYKRLDGHVETKVIFAQRYSPGDLAYVLDGKNATPLYTAQPQRKPLTDDEIALISVECAASHQHDDIQFARAVIAKATGEKE